MNAGKPKSFATPGAAAMLFRTGVQKHDDEDEQHHHRARVDNDLCHGDELGAEQQVKNRQKTP